MHRPFKRFCYSLAKELGVSVHTVMSWTSTEIMEWAAFFMTQNEKWIEKYNIEAELKRQSELSPEELKALFQATLFSGVKNG